MKLATIIIAVVVGGIYFISSKYIASSSGNDFYSFYKSLPAKGFGFDLYDDSIGPIDEFSIKTLNGSYLDLIEFGKDSKYVIKIPQIQHEDAMSDLRKFYLNVKKMKLCKKTLDKKLYDLCNSDQEKARNLFNYVVEQIETNAQAPYKNAREYFYLNFKTILNEDQRD